MLEPLYCFPRIIFVTQRLLGSVRYSTHAVAGTTTGMGSFASKPTEIRVSLGPDVTSTVKLSCPKSDTTCLISSAEVAGILVVLPFRSCDGEGCARPDTKTEIVCSQGLTTSTLFGLEQAVSKSPKTSTTEICLAGSSLSRGILGLPSDKQGPPKGDYIPS